MGKHFLGLILILVFSLIGLKALVHPGLFTAHDIWHQVARLYHYQKAVSDGQFPPYWIGTLANGFGYPLFFFSYHLPWISGLPFLSLGISIPETLKILFILSYLFSGFSMYILANEIFKNKVSALLSSIIYLWAPYRFLTILVSAAVGTAFAFVFLPILLLGIYKTCNDKLPGKGVVLTAIGLSGIILSHFLSFAAVVPLSVLFVLWSLKPHKEFALIRLKNLLLGFVLGLGISSFYFLPAVYYSKFTQVATGHFSSLYQNEFVNLGQVIYSKWGYGLNKISAKEQAVPYQLGAAQWLSTVAGTALILFSLFARKLKIKTQIFSSRRFISLGIVLLGSFIFSIFLMLEYSRPLWDFIIKFIVLDYPTIFLLPATFTAALIGGTVFTSLKKPINYLFFALIILISVYANRNYLRVNTYADIPLELYVASEITTNSFHEYLPKTADVKIFSEENRLILPANIEVADFGQNTTTFSILAFFPEDIDAAIRHLSFPGINLYLDGQRKEINRDDLGRIKLNVPKGVHRIVVRFEETVLIKASKLITIASIFILFFLTKKSYAKKEKA